MGKLRLVINLRYLNQLLLKDKFKYEDLRVAMSIFQQGDYMITFNLKSGYHHVDIHHKHWQFLGFSWEQDHSKQFYVFCVLPFGLATACYLFTKLLRPLVRYLRNQGLRVVVYLDDGIAAGTSAKQALKVSRQIQEDLCSAGFITNIEKSKWVPSQQCAWLGFEIDIAAGRVSVPQQKIEALQSQLCQATKNVILPARSWACLTGKIISMSIAIGPVARLMTRGMYTLLNTRVSWSQALPLSDEARAEILFWNAEIQKFNGQNIWVGPSALRVVYTDASDSGYARYTVHHGCHIA